MERKNKSLGMKLFALFVMSNLSSFMLGSSASTQIEIPQNEKLEINERAGYVTMQLEVEVRAALTPLEPLTITNKKQSVYIPFVFYVNKLSQPVQGLSGFEEQSQTEKIRISVPKKYVSQLLGEHSLVLIPQIAKEHLRRKPKRRNYEIHY